MQNILGQEVVMLFDGESEAGELKRVQFNRNGLAKGLYFTKLEFNGKGILRKVMVR